MIKQVFALTLLVLFIVFLPPILAHLPAQNSLEGVAAHYAEQGAGELGAMNLVTAIVVTYRGLDTLGEVSVLFIAATAIAVLLRRKQKPEHAALSQRRDASEIVKTGAHLIAPVLLMFGGYIFINGHLSPGGGFQGGAVIATTVLLLMLASPDFKTNHKILGAIESYSGFFYVVTGLLGMIFAAGFLDNRFFPLGQFGTILSAGAIPVIYTLVGLKVGTELSTLLENMQRELE